MAGYYTITTADNGKVLGFPLMRRDGDANNFVGATATLCLRFQDGTLSTRPLVFNPQTAEWEYAVVANEFAAGRYWVMVAVTFPAPIGGPIYSGEATFDVVAAD
jgi:hypothetical protein